MGATRMFGQMVDVTRTTDQDDTIYKVSGDEWRLKQVHKECTKEGLEPTAIDDGSFTLQANKFLDGPTVAESSAPKRALFQMLTSGLPARPVR